MTKTVTEVISAGRFGFKIPEDIISDFSVSSGLLLQAANHWPYYAAKQRDEAISAIKPSSAKSSSCIGSIAARLPGILPWLCKTDAKPFMIKSTPSSKSMQPMVLSAYETRPFQHPAWMHDPSR